MSWKADRLSFFFFAERLFSERQSRLLEKEEREKTFHFEMAYVVLLFSFVPFSLMRSPLITARL